MWAPTSEFFLQAGNRSEKQNPPLRTNAFGGWASCTYFLNALGQTTPVEARLSLKIHKMRRTALLTGDGELQSITFPAYKENAKHVCWGCPVGSGDPPERISKQKLCPLPSPSSNGESEQVCHGESTARETSDSNRHHAPPGRQDTWTLDSSQALATKKVKGTEKLTWINDGSDIHILSVCHDPG